MSNIQRFGGFDVDKVCGVGKWMIRDTAWNTEIKISIHTSGEYFFLLLKKRFMKTMPNLKAKRKNDVHVNNNNNRNINNNNNSKKITK